MTPEQWIVTGIAYIIFVAIATIWSYQRWVKKKKYDSIMYRRDL
jgi:hypothetical protein